VGDTPVIKPRRQTEEELAEVRRLADRLANIELPTCRPGIRGRCGNPDCPRCASRTVAETADDSAESAEREGRQGCP
jgi:hypothetical protein